MSLDETGFTRQRLPDIKRQYDELFTEALGPVNTEPDSVTGQLIGIFSAALDDLYEDLQDTYDAMYPYSAEGTSLDGSVAFVGIERLPATPTVVTAVAYGVEGAVIPQGALTRATDNRQYFAIVDSTISALNAVDVEIAVDTVAALGNYQIIAGGVSVVYTADANPTENEILTGLAALFDPGDFTATVADGRLRVRSANGIDDFTIVTDSKLTIEKLGSPVVFEGVNLGAYQLPAGGLTRIDTSVIGWDSVNNLVAGATGRFVETDEELRIRHRQAVRVVGAATVQAIRARLVQEVPEVTSVAVYENRLNVEVAEMPAHSFEAVVSGGDNQAIADKLWQVKPAGIETTGNVSVQVLDENGDLQLIKFSRPITKYAWVRVSVNLLNPEEPLTQQAAAAITDAVLTYGATLGVADNIIPQRFYGQIYAETSGIASITVEVAATDLPGDTPSYVSVPVDIARDEVAEFSSDRVVVVGV